jgi:hypothetical protein
MTFSIENEAHFIEKMDLFTVFELLSRGFPSVLPKAPGSLL